MKVCVSSLKAEDKLEIIGWKIEHTQKIWSRNNMIMLWNFPFRHFLSYIEEINLLLSFFKKEAQKQQFWFFVYIMTNQLKYIIIYQKHCDAGGWWWTNNLLCMI